MIGGIPPWIPAITIKRKEGKIIRNNQYKLAPKTKINITKTDGSGFVVKAYNLREYHLDSMNNGKVNPNSILIMRYFANNVVNQVPFKADHVCYDFNYPGEVLTYSLEQLPVSKEVFFQVKNQLGEVLFVAKANNRAVTLTDLFGDSELLAQNQAKINQVIREVQNVVKVEKSAICDEFASYEFLLHNRNAKTKILISDIPSDKYWFSYCQEAYNLTAFAFERGTTLVKKKKVNRLAKNNKVTYDDIYGHGEPIRLMQEIGQLLSKFNSVKNTGITIPSVLLVGASGTGKTMLAHAFFNEHKIKVITPYISYNTKSIDWPETFKEAKSEAPAAIFIDEICKLDDDIDASLFTEMSNASGNQGVFVIATANRTYNLPEELFRPGRFDRKIYFDFPTNEDKAKMLIDALAKAEIDHDIDGEYFAELMGSCISNAHIATYINEVKMQRLTNNSRLTANELLNIIERVNLGYQYVKPLTVEHYETVIAHEAGHATAAILLHGPAAVVKVDVRNSLGYQGVVQLLSTIPYYTENLLKAKVKVALAGIAAERLIIGEVGLGSFKDMQYAQSILEEMVANHGVLGATYTTVNMFQTMASFGTEKSKNQVIDIVADILSACEKEVAKLLNDNRLLLEAIINRLKEKPLLLNQDINELLNYLDIRLIPNSRDNTKIGNILNKT